MRSLIRAANLFLIVFLASMLTFCEEAENPTEAPKSIDGKWQIVKISRNESDITEAMDFSQFTINFSTDNTYSMEHYIPFIVRNGGTWSVDDPLYPFKIIFQEDGKTEPLVTELNFPIVQGKRQISLTFSPGCTANKYEYILEKVTE